MKLISFFILFTIFEVLAAHHCGCKENCRRKIKVQEDKDPEIKVIYTGTACACQKALPFRVEKPVVPKYKLRKHKYNVEIKVEESEPDCRYIFNTKVEKPTIEKVKLHKYPIRVEELLEECKHHPRFIYSVKVEKPEEKCETQLDGLVAKVDKIVVPIEDCLQPCCHPEKSETPKNKIKKCDSSEEILTDSSEEICTKSKKYRKVPKKIQGCLKCEALDSGCGCSESSEEIVTDSSEEICTKNKKYRKVPKKIQGCAKCEALESDEGCGCSESSEEICTKNNIKVPKVQGCPKCEALESDEGCGCSESSEEIVTDSSEEICPKFKKYTKVPKKIQGCPKCEALDEGCGCNVESSEEIRDSSEEICPKYRKVQKKCDVSSEEYLRESSEEAKCSRESESEASWEYFKCCNKNCPKKPESSEEIQTQTSEECSDERSPKKCESSEEVQAASSEEVKSCADSGEVYEEEYCTKGKPVKVVKKERKHSRYSNDDCGNKRFSRYKRELFLDDMHDFSVYTEPMTRNEIQKTIAQLRANSTLAKRRRKGRKRPKSLVQNRDQFEEYNKFKDGDLILDNPKDLELEFDLKQLDDRGKRHLECGTIERLKKKPRYDMDTLADAGCSQYIPEIIRQDQEYLDYMNNRNKRHLSTFDGNANFPIKMVDATKKTNPHHHHWKKIQYRRPHHSAKQIPQKPNFEVDPKFYYKYLSLTAPNLSQRKEDASADAKIVYDHLGHKFHEFNGFRTLIRPKIEYVDDSSYEKPKFWTCKEDLINPEDFGKVTTISANTEPLNTLTTEGLDVTTEGTNVTTSGPNVTTSGPNVTTAGPPDSDLQEQELNLCEYLKKLEQTQNFTVQQEAKTVFLHNCEEYIKFLLFNPSTEDKITETTQKYLENLLLNTHLKNHIRKLFVTKQKFENNLTEITNLLHKPKVVENFKNFLLFKNELDSIRNKLNLTDYGILHFYADVNLIITEMPLN